MGGKPLQLLGAQRYETFYGCNLLMLPINWRVSPSLVNLSGLVKCLRVSHPRVCSWPYPQAVDKAGQNKHTCLLRKFVNYSLKKLLLGPEAVLLVVFDPSMNELWVT